MTKSSIDKQLSEVVEYFSEKIVQHGDVPLGVGWKDSTAQEVRFEQLCRIIQENIRFNILDYGCGYGALLPFLKNKYSDFKYTGIDISKQMIDVAKRNHGYDTNVKFLVSKQPSQVFDYSVASGVFNIKLLADNTLWLNHVYESLSLINSASRLGFSVNFLSSYSDVEKRNSDLFYADPLEIFNFCKKNLSPNVALIHDYGMWDFTILVRNSIE